VLLKEELKKLDRLPPYFLGSMALGFIQPIPPKERKEKMKRDRK